MNRKRKAKRTGEFVLATLPLLYLGFVSLDRSGMIDRMRGLDKVEAFVSNIETSYRTGVRRQSRPSDPEWSALLKLIRKYSTADFPREREPKVIARGVALASNKVDLAGGEVAEWTSPGTPVIEIYVDWPVPGQPVSEKDFSVIGTIGDFRPWLDKSRGDLRFIVQDGFLASFTVLVGLFIWFLDR